MFHAARNANSMGASRPIVALSPHHFERLAARDIQTTHDHLSSSINLMMKDWLLFWLLLFHFFIETILDLVSGQEAAWTYKAARHGQVSDAFVFASQISTHLILPRSLVLLKQFPSLSFFLSSIISFPVLSFSKRVREHTSNAGVVVLPSYFTRYPKSTFAAISFKYTESSDLHRSICN
jgi:hypothetical protein